MAQPGSAQELASALCGWIDRLFPDVERGRRLTQAIQDRFGDDPRAVTGALCRDVEAVAHEFSRHFALEHVEDGGLAPDVEPPGWPPQEPDEVELRAGSVGEVVRRPDGVAVVSLDGLDAVHLAAPYLRAAFALVRGADGVILDLRRNGGGDPGTVALVLDWLLGAGPRHISDVIYLDRTRQWWTTGRLGDLALRPATPVAVLICERTFSSGEALAYHVRSQGRGTLVGRPTPGAADHITPVRITSHVRAFLPEARVRDAVTGTNWEGTGVVPDVACAPVDALDAAVEALRQQRLAPGAGTGPGGWNGAQPARPGRT